MNIEKTHYNIQYNEDRETELFILGIEDCIDRGDEDSLYPVLDFYVKEINRMMKNGNSMEHKVKTIKKSLRGVSDTSLRLCDVCEYGNDPTDEHCKRGFIPRDICTVFTLGCCECKEVNIENSELEKKFGVYRRTINKSFQLF